MSHQVVAGSPVFSVQPSGPLSSRTLLPVERPSAVSGVARTILADGGSPRIVIEPRMGSIRTGPLTM